MPKYKPLYSLYKGLKESKYDVPDSYVSFQKTLTQAGDAGAKSRRGLYKSLKESNYDVPDTYEDFYKNLFVPVNSTTSRALKIGENPNTPAVNRYHQKLFDSVDPNKNGLNALSHRAVSQAKRAMNNVRKPVTAKVVDKKGKPTGEEFAITPAKTVEDLDREYAQETTKNWENELHDQMADADKDAAKISDMFKSFIGSTDEVGSVWGNMTRGGGIAGTPHSVTTNNGLMKNTEARQLLIAGDYNRKRRELLQLEQDSRNGDFFDNHSFFRGMYDAAKDTGFLTGGASDLINAGSLLATKQDLDNGIHTEAGDMLMQQAVKNSDAQSQYGDNKGWMYTGGVITTNMAPFMVQIASAGFSKGLSTSIGKVVQGAASKVALGTMKKAAGFASADLAKNIGKVTGLTTKAFGKAIQYGIVGAAQANTVGLGNVANDVINRYTGQVYQDEQGNYKFGTFDSDGNLVHEGGEDFLTAFVKGEAAQTIEFATELAGGGIDAAGTALKNFVTKGGKKIINKYNMENVSKVIDFLLNNKVAKNVRYLKAGADRTLGKVELNSIVGEPLEEELDIIANTVFTGDNKISDLWDEKQQSQIWGGMLLSIGLMKGAVAPFHAYNAKQYYSYKHKLNKADVNLSQLLGNEKWEELRNQIDATTNEDMPEMVNKINRDVALGKNRQPVREYIQNLLIMRGYDIGNMLAAKKAVEDKGKGVSVKNMEKNQAYQQGRDAYGYDTHEIQLDQEDKQKSLAQLLGISEQQLASMSDEELESFSGRDDNIDRAIYDYQLSSARYEGVVDNARDQIDLEVQRAAQAVDMYTDKSRNTIRNATIKASGGAEDYGVYIISGNIATHDDGSIDVNNSDDMILYYDPTTNTVEHADAMMFAELGSEENADEVRSQAMTDAKEKAIKETTGIIDGVVEVGTQFNTVDEYGTEHTYEVLADNGDGTAMITIDGNIPTELVKGENVNIPVFFEELQKMKDESDQQRLQAAKAQREQVEKERAAQQTQETEQTQPSFDFNKILNDDGNVVLADVLEKDGNTKYPGSTLFLIRDAGAKAKVVELKNDGSLVPHAVNKEDVRSTQPMSLDEYKQAFAASSMIEDNSGDNRGEIEVEAPTTEGETAGSAEETAAPESTEATAAEQTPNTEQSPSTPAITLEDGTIVPMLEDGNPDFSKLTAAQTAELYDTQFDEDAEGILSGYVSDAKKALDKANNMTVKGKTFVEQKSAKAAKEKAIADAQSAYDSAVAIRDAYNERQLAKEENTHEGRKSLIEKARRKYARLKNSEEWSERPGDLWNETVGKLLHRLYDATGIDVFDDTPNTVYEYVAANVGPYSLNYEGNDNSKGVQQETGLSRSDFAKLGWLAAEGKGMTIDAKVHRLWENRPSNLESADTQEIRNALISLITSGQTAFQARDYILNQRIELAESALEEQLRQEEDAAEAQKDKEEEEKKKAELEKKKAEEEKTNENGNATELSHEQQKAMEDGDKLGFPAFDKEGEPINQNVIELANWAKEQGLEIDPTSKLNSYADLFVMCKDGFGVSTLVPDVGEDINQVFYFPVNVQGEQLLKLQEEFNVGRALKHSADMNSELTEGAMFYDGDTAREFKEFVDKKVEEQNKVFGEQLSEDKVPFKIEGEKSGVTYDINDKEDRKRLVAENSVDDKDILDIDMPKHVHKAIKELCKKMGLKVQFLYMGARSNGWIENGTMYLALDTEKATQFVFGHEMTHVIKQKNPEAYKELVNVAMSVTTRNKFEEDLEKVYQNYHGISGYNNVDDYVEEVVADNLGKFINDFDLAQKFSLRLNHPVLATILHAIQKIKSLLYGDFYKSVDALERIVEKAYVETANGEFTNSETGENVSFSLRQKPEPKKKGVGYKVFVLKDGKLYPPMVANPDGAATPVGVWLDADAAPIAGESKTGRPQVKQGGKGTQGGSGKLAYRPGWHLGVVPYAIQFNRKDAEGNKTLFPKNFVFAEVEYAADVDYQEEARQEGINPSGKYQNSLAGLKHLPTDGYYMYRTNPNPETDPWVITGAMKVNRILTRAEQADLVSKAGREPQQIQEGDIVTDDVVNSINQEIADAPKFSLKVYHGSGADFTEFDFDHMGEGAGSQVFGWGGYVTSSKKIGKSYANLVDANAPYQDVEYVGNNAHEYTDVVAGLFNGGQRDYDDVKEFLQNGYNTDKENARKKQMLEWFESTKPSDWKSVNDGKRNLYEVDIPDDNGSNYLDWENPLNEEQINAIRDALAKKGVDVSSWEKRGFKLDLPFKNVYAAVLPMMMRFEPKEVSKFLSSLGFTGIKYPAGTIQGGAEEGDTNYVIFKPEDMRITEHTKFSIKTYHGSQASFDHFDHSFMGSGEGAKVIAERNNGGNKEGKMNYVIFDENNAQITNHTKFSLRLKSAIEETETNPSDAQKESGNYKKGHIKFGGYDYTIENPKGSTRSGKDANGKEWKITMHDTYGYIRGKFGKDGDHLDMFINDKADLDNWNGDVFVVDQVNSDGSFDEHKVMYGYDSMDDAEKAYLANYSKGWKGLGNITGATKDEFDKWLDTSNRKIKPFADYAKVNFSQAKSVDNDEPKTFEEFLNHPLLKFSIKNEEQRKAAENAYKYAAKLRPNKYAQYAIVDMSKPSKIPEYYEKKVLADNWRRFYNRAVRWGNYKLFDLDRPFADQVNEVKGKVPDEFDAPDKVTNKDNIKGTDRQVSYAAEPRYSLKDEKIKSVAEKFGVNEDDVAMYANAVEKGSTAEAARSRANIKRYLLQANEDKISSFKDIIKYTKPINEALKESFGDLDAMIEERRKQVEAQRNAMEAARKRAQEEEEKRQKHLDELSLIPTDELDKRYMDAIDNNDESTAREMLDESARRNGYGDVDSDYQGQGAWAAPSNPQYESDEARRSDIENSPDVNLEDIALGYNLQPDDYFDNPRAYMNNTAYGLESAHVIKNALDAIKNGEKDVKVKVYRAVPTSVKEGKLRNGDWVTPSKKYAEMHGDNRLDGKYRIIEDEVPANQLWWDGNDVNEFGFDDGKEYRYKNAKNNRKLNDLITYDNKGNVIPPSKRFNSRKSDIRFSLKEEKEKIVADAKANGTYMTAPNGEKTKLDAEQWATVRTTNFKNWFGDWENDPENASKVVDENGEPMVVWHGRSAEFNTFEKKEGVRFIMGLEDKVKAEGFFFSPDKGLAEEFASNSYRHRGGKSNVVPCFLNIRRPMDLTGEDYDRIYEDVTGWEYMVGMDTQDNLWGIMDEEGMADKIKEKGYDGAIFVEEVDDRYEPTKISYCALDANQIKSAENNNGDFSADNDDVRFSLRYDQFEQDLNKWKKDNNLPKDAQRPTIPQRNVGESAVDFLRRVDEYRKQMALWKTAPTYEQHLLSDDTALGEFNRELQRGSVLKRIAFQDSMLAIRKAQEAIMKEVGVDRLNMAEDAYTAENRSHGKGKNEFEEYNNEFLQPLRKAYHQMKKVLGDSYDNVRLYMMAKHGLERNAQMAFKKSLEADYEDVAQRIAAYKAYKGDINRMGNDSGFELGLIDYATWVRKDNAIKMKYSPSYMKYRYDKMGITSDYSGLSALFDGSDFEEAAHKLVRDIESKHIVETKELWDATNAATKKILRDGYKAGMMSKDTYQYVRDMYSHYIPLRGWDGTTADQVWDYVGGGKGAFNQTLKKAHGRTSIADDPIAYIENMAESGILLNNKNWVKQHLMLLAQNHPTSLLTLSKAWYVKSRDANGNEEWVPATPQITSQMNSNQVKAAIDAFEQKMEQMEQTGDATQKRDGLNISYPQTHSEEREHEVRVMKDGEEYVIYVNGDPQLAQAMNNTRAHRVREIQSGKLDRAAAWIGRKMAAAYTSLSPLFIPSNYFRDLTMTLASTAIREDAKYNYLLRKNLATSWNLGFMLKDYQSGKLREKVNNGNATPKEQMFYDFMMNGGETGFVSSLDVEDLKKKFKNDLKDLNRWKANPVKVGHTIMDCIEFLNRAIEDSNRFAIYMTSIQYGRSIDEAVNDAKNATLNFNRKGTGEYGWQMIRNLYLFINPAVQSLQNLGALAKHHPFKFTAVTASWIASGVLVPIVNAALMQMAAAFGGGDDDKKWYKDISKKYWQFSKWDRRNNFIMWVPFTHEFIKIPLAQEFRVFYGVGDMIASKMMGGELTEESWSQYGEDLLGQVVDMLPLDPTGYDGNIAVSLMPNPIRPIFELAFNVDFTGKPLFKDTEYNKYDPNFTKAYVGTPDWLVRASRMVNSIGNDYPDVQQNSIDALGNPRYNLNNPAVVDHVLSSYLGGAYTMGSQVLGLLTKSLNDPKEIKVADIPLFSKFVSNPDDRPVTKKQGDEFWNMKENHDRAANTLSKLKKKAKVDGDYSLLERFYGSEEYKRYKQDDVKVKKYEEYKKKERAEESGDEYRPHKLNAEDIYKAHAAPKDDFEDLKMEQLYTKLNVFKSTYDLLVETAPSQSDGYYNANKAAIDAIDEISLGKQEISELKKGFLDDGKDAYNAEGMKRIRELRKKVLAVLEKANKVVVANQKAKKK